MQDSIPSPCQYDVLLGRSERGGAIRSFPYLSDSLTVSVVTLVCATGLRYFTSCVHAHKVYRLTVLLRKYYRNDNLYKQIQ